MQTHLFRYNHNGLAWQVEIIADDERDAKDRLARLAFASYLGVRVMTMPIYAAPLAPVVVWLRNAARDVMHRFGGGRHS